jgi:hypothetical protein
LCSEHAQIGLQWIKNNNELMYYTMQVLACSLVDGVACGHCQLHLWLSLLLLLSSMFRSQSLGTCKTSSAGAVRWANRCLVSLRSHHEVVSVCLLLLLLLLLAVKERAYLQQVQLGQPGQPVDAAAGSRH